MCAKKSTLERKTHPARSVSVRVAPSQPSDPLTADRTLLSHAYSRNRPGAMHHVSVRTENGENCSPAMSVGSSWPLAESMAKTRQETSEAWKAVSAKVTAFTLVPFLCAL